ncbi:ubiquitin-associated domain-containing protein 1 isoform X1 [Anopheles darlingi]|uniref:ubiquitin-associated domain-containing protein 1 isoform X1 n=1 Tax=Anopheles darlingi TaxID=43151 RepID=UPI0021003C02|nr:ubiquitin-associated domain-containing protein 1 isoform X1 [Anopheles darlingi]
MIPWMREKFAERRARWQQARKQPRTNNGDGNSSCSSASSVADVASTEPSSSGTASPTASPVHTTRQQRGHRQGQRGSRTHQLTSLVSQQPSNSGGSALSPWRSRKSRNGTDEEQNVQPGTEQKLSLKIISPRGGMVDIDVSRTLNGRQLKMHSLEKFASNAFTMPHFSSNLDELADRYRLIRAQNKLVFRDDDILLGADVRDYEEFLLVAKRIETPLIEEGLKGPSSAEILTATRHISLSRINQASVNFNFGMLQGDDLHQDLRRIIISLSKASAFVVGSGPCAEKLITLFQQRLINRKRHQISSIETLLEMGFSLDKINQALQITKNVFPAAIDWLIQHDSTAKLFNCDRSASPGASLFATASTIPNNSNTNNRRKASDADNDSGSLSTPSSTRESIDEIEEKDPFTRKQENVAKLLEIVRVYSEKSVEADPDLLLSISEMGFDESSVREALVATHNSKSAACEWLLGNRTKSMQGLKDEQAVESPILRVLMASPQVQISLGNPRMLIALISMLDNYSTMTMWFTDNDTSSVLGHILRTYHEEKHILAINQFNNAQQHQQQQRPSESIHR